MTQRLVHLYMPVSGICEASTKNFDPSCMLGSGTFGSVGIRVGAWSVVWRIPSSHMCGESRGGGNNNQVTMSFFGLLAVFFFFGMLQFFGASL